MISTIIVRYKLLSKKKDFYLWKKKMDEVIQKYKGFLDKTELPTISNTPYHSVILRFNNQRNAERWLNSSDRKTLLRMTDEIVEEYQEILYEDDLFWFDILSKRSIKKWKQVIVSFIAVYPLTQIIPISLGTILKNTKIQYFLWGGILNGMIISFCMVYFAMPFVLKFSKKWLNKK